MPGTFIDNPIAWAHFKVRGGWRNHLWSLGGYTLLITAGIVISARLSTTGFVFNGWTSGLLGLQLAIGIFFGCGTIGNAIRRDIASGLLESHRLMPVAPASAVLGYLTGPTLQSLVLIAVNFVLGTVTASFGAVPMDKWLMANLIVAFFVGFMWVGVAFASSIAKNAFALLVGALLPAAMTAGHLLDLIPGLAVLATPISGYSIFMVVAQGRAFPLGMGWAVAAQITFAAIFFRGAMRRYRRDDVPALSVILGLLLLATWVGTSAVGVARIADFRPSWVMGRNEGFTPHARMIAALLTSMLLGIAPIAASARGFAEWSRNRRLSATALPRRPLQPEIVACLAMLVLLPILFALPAKSNDRTVRVTVALILIAFFLSISYLLRIFYRRGKSAGWITAGWIIVTWLVPVGVDALLPNTLSPRASVISLFSPWGALINLWSEERVPNFAGLGGQLLIAVAMGTLFYATARKTRAQPAPNAIR